MSKSTTSSGVSFLGLLTLLFITLKLTGDIDWSWWLVLGPIWIPPIIFLVLSVVFAFLYWAYIAATGNK